MPEKQRRTIVIGCGTRLMGDDAAGLEVVAGLCGLPHVPCELCTYENGLPPGFLTELPSDAMLLFIDAVQSQSAPGTIVCLRLPSQAVRPRHLRPLSTHAMGLDQEIALAKKLRLPIPRMFLVGVEGIEFRPESGLSPRVRVAVDEIVRNFPRYLKLARDLA